MLAQALCEVRWPCCPVYLCTTAVGKMWLLVFYVCLSPVVQTQSPS
jgi:hypothetical protein